jgi:hypothetical protein
VDLVEPEAVDQDKLMDQDKPVDQASHRWQDLYKPEAADEQWTRIASDGPGQAEVVDLEEPEGVDLDKLGAVDQGELEAVDLEDLRAVDQDEPEAVNLDKLEVVAAPEVAGAGLQMTPQRGWGGPADASGLVAMVVLGVLCPGKAGGFAAYDYANATNWWMSTPCWSLRCAPRQHLIYAVERTIWSSKSRTSGGYLSTGTLQVLLQSILQVLVRRRRNPVPEAVGAMAGGGTRLLTRQTTVRLDIGVSSVHRHINISFLAGDLMDAGDCSTGDNGGQWARSLAARWRKCMRSPSRRSTPKSMKSAAPSPPTAGS